MIKRIFGLGFITLLVLGFLAVQFYLKPRLPVINGYSAHLACSCHYLAGRSLEAIKKEDLNFSPLNHVKLKIDQTTKTVSSTFFGLGKKTAVYKEDLGCMLLKGDDNYKVESQIGNAKTRNRSGEINLPPYVSDGAAIIPSGLEKSDFDKVISEAFDQDQAFLKKTRALAIVQRDTLIFEHYGSGIDKNTPLIGWSMTKSLTNALIGILVGDEKLSIEDKFKEDNWRESVSLNDLLQMNSGIEWAEIYDQVTDATEMLYDSEMSAQPMIENSTAFKPGTHWEYSSGTTNYISKIIRETLKQDLVYQRLPYERLAAPLDANSFIMEMDESGHYIMSSYGYATARDWAKFGLLYLHDGVWGDKRILPEGWVEYSTQVNQVSDDLGYGAHIWLNTNQNKFKSAPADTYYFSGFQGQKVIVIPSLELVVVRLGLGDDPGFDMDAVLKEIMEVFSSR